MDFVTAVIVLVSEAIGFCLCYFFVKPHKNVPVSSKAHQQLRAKPSFSNPMITYRDDRYEQFESPATKLMNPIKPKRESKKDGVEIDE
jgi:hypothetical protein